MNRHVALRALCWKEVRQVLPLVWMQLGLGFCFQLLFLFQSDQAAVPRPFVLVTMPCLFAVGVGVLLVGQEKERRTLDWLRALPIAARALVAVKLATGFVALLAVWVLNLLLAAVFVLPSGGWSAANSKDAWLVDPGWEYLWPLQSVFLLAAGFATAWVFRSSLVALLALVPLTLVAVAVMPKVDDLHHWIAGSTSIPQGPTSWLMAVAWIILSVLLLMVGWRRGMRVLAPEQVSEKWFSRNRPQDASWAEGAIWARSPYTPAAMLIWQFLRQNQTVLLGIAALLLLALGLLIAAPSAASLDAHSAARLVLAGFFGLLAASWLGVLAFQGDGLQDRIRFLAERGISPTKIWWTRHAPPLSLLALALFGFAFFLRAGFADGRFSPWVMLLVLGTYAISQAVGQVFRSSTIAAIAAPAVTWALAAYVIALVELLGVPYWLLAVCGLLPWLATFLLMRRWMDGRLGWGFWGAHATFLAVGMILPVVPAGLVLISRPSMPAEARRQLTAESQGYGTAYAEPRELVLRFRNPDLPDVPAQSRRLEAQIVCKQLEHDLSIAPGPIRFVPREMVYLLGEARLARMALEQNGDAEANRERYRRTLTLIGTMVERLRLSWRLFDQDGADLTEIWLVNELGRSQARAWLGLDSYGRLVRAVADEQGRNAARRRAVVMSWAAHGTRSDTQWSSLGGYGWRGDAIPVLCKVNRFVRQRDADYLTWRMLQRLERSDSAGSAERTKELARYWGVPALHYGLGPDGEFFRADNLADFAMPLESFSRTAPGSQWHAGWERTAHEMADSLDK
jgi:hypothetical protein